ncbi:hypothetical protein K435DRAFT_892704 [Dendrothele bispora CBS 962.96]|uniref:Uncharacterized protein n=1 Tax=Dendrothele bispora (strain CBS 962.96) TaxID=1314807 RepID=A0A4S8KP91_DENBC|nr:hypothetical protein K435DRAFT_892704 [Dendrothele bispora CBS 962.96]
MMDSVVYRINVLPSSIDTSENAVKARILQARVRMSMRSDVLFGANKALAPEPDNPEANVLLHQQSLNVKELLAPTAFFNTSITVFDWNMEGNISVFPQREIYIIGDVGTHGEPKIVGSGYGNWSMDFQTEVGMFTLNLLQGREVHSQMLEKVFPLIDSFVFTLPKSHFQPLPF